MQSLLYLPTTVITADHPSVNIPHTNWQSHSAMHLCQQFRRIKTEDKRNSAERLHYKPAQSNHADVPSHADSTTGLSQSSCFRFRLVSPRATCDEAASAALSVSGPR